MEHDDWDVVYAVVNRLYITFVVVTANAKLRHAYKATTLDGLLAESAAHKEKALEFEQSLKRSGLALLVTWPFFLVPALLSALYAAMLLLYNFVAHQITGLPSWPL
jgi:hypothetical protein